MPAIVRRSDLIYPELSYQLIGCAFDVFNELGFGYHEKYYQRAYAEALRLKNIKFIEQIYYPLKFKEKTVGKHFFDFLAEDKVIVELKKDNRYSKQHIDRVNDYLKVSGVKLAILINFTRTGVIYKRMVNL